jgi:tetratricopeptide (TPR) repeat protein
MNALINSLIRYIAAGGITLILTCCYTIPEPIDSSPDPNSAFEYYSRALNQYLDEDQQAALSNVNKAIEYNPFIAQFYNLKGDILRDLYRFSESLDAYEKSVAIRVYNPELYEKMGIVSYRLEEYDQAIQYHKKALAQDPARITLNLHIAENYYWMDYLQLALNFAESYKKRADLGKELPVTDYLRIMGNIKYAMHAYEQAQEYYERYFSQGDEVPVPEAKALLHAYMELGKREQAYTFLLERASVVMNSGDTHFFRGLYYFKGDNLKDARLQLELALQSNTSEIDAYLYLGKIYYALGENSRALAMFRQYREKGGRSIIDEAPL